MLLGVSEIINKTWANYQKNWRAFTPYLVGMIIPSLVIYIVGYLGVILDTKFGLGIFTTILTVVIMILAGLFTFWLGIAFAKAVRASFKNEPIEDWQTGLKKSTHVIAPALIASILVGVIIFAGTLLLIIPGMIFAGWYCFTFYIVVFEDKKNTAALKASKDMVVGRWWSIIWRLAVPGILFAIISGIVQSIVVWPFSKIGALDVYNIQVITNIIGSIVSAVFAPLFVGFPVMLYLNAKENPVINIAPPAEIK